MVQIKAAWPKLAFESIGLYSGFIREQAGKVGRQNCEHALRDAINHEPDLPSIAKLKAYFPNAEKALTEFYDPNCGCWEGWRPVNPEHRNGAVKRCSCWRSA